MIYFGALLSMICLLLGSLIIASVKDLLSQDSKVSRSSLKRAQLFLSMSLIVFLLSPLVPISYLPYESDQIEDNDSEGIYLFPVTMLAIDDWVFPQPMMDMMMMIWMLQAQQLGIMLWLKICSSC